MFEERWKDIVLDIGRFDTVGGAALLHHLQNDLLHLLVGRLELTDEDQHDLTRIVVCILGIHQWDQITDGLPNNNLFISIFQNKRARINKRSKWKKFKQMYFEWLANIFTLNRRANKHIRLK